MPELPDVEVFKRYFDATALHQEIDEVEVRNTQALAKVSGPELASRLTGHAFSGTSRHGKYLFAVLDDDDVLVLHFGMTGRLGYYRDSKDEPEYTQVLCTFRNGYHLAYASMRKLGELRLIRDVDAFIRAKELGPDALDVDFCFDDFRERLFGRRGMIKTRLMDQRIMAGIGNVYSDEILFQARVHPRAPVDRFDDGKRRAVFDNMKSVLGIAIDHDAQPSHFPDDFIIPQRHDHGECPVCGSSVERVKVGGHFAYFCPRCQGNHEEWNHE